MQRSLRLATAISPLGYAIGSQLKRALQAGSNIADPDILTEYAENTERATSEGVECWIQYEGEHLQLPVAPFFDIATGMQNEKLTLYELGEVNIKGTPKLKMTSLESFFPHLGHDYYFVQYPYSEDPYDTCKKLMDWMKDEKPLKLIITNTSISMPILIDDIQYGEQDGTRDVYFSLSVSEYVVIEAPEQATAFGTTVANARPGSAGGSTEWTLTYGDQLTGIAAAVYGDPDEYTKIIELNDWIDNPDSLKAHEGKVIKLV